MLLDAKNISHPTIKTRQNALAIVVKFLVWRALVLVLWRLQIQRLRVVLSEGLGVERVHEALQKLLKVSFSLFML